MLQSNICTDTCTCLALTNGTRGVNWISTSQPCLYLQMRNRIRIPSVLSARIAGASAVRSRRTMNRTDSKCFTINLEMDLQPLSLGPEFTCDDTTKRCRAENFIEQQNQKKKLCTANDDGSTGQCQDEERSTPHSNGDTLVCQPSTP